jgi:alpha-N-acetylglucosaminidase
MTRTNIGHVPKEFVSKFPNVKISRSPDWANFNSGNPVTAPYADVYLMEPTEKLFAEIGNKYIALQASTFGSDHIYNTDTYNEMDPPTWNATYLTEASEAVYAGMVGADPDAIWLMQGWLFIHPEWTAPRVEAYLAGVPPAKMWLLDLFGDSSHGARFSAEIYTRGCHWIPRMFA